MKEKLDDFYNNEAIKKSSFDDRKNSRHSENSFINNQTPLDY